MRRLILAQCLLLLAAADRSWGVGQSKEQLPASPLQLLDSTAAATPFSWEQLKSGTAVLSIWNPSDRDEVSIQVTDFSQSGREKAFDVVIQSPTVEQPDVFTLQKQAITRIALKLKGDQNVSPAAGLYTGLLVIQDIRKAFQPFSKQLTVKVTSPQPALSKFTLIAWRLVPFSPLWCARARVPLKDSDFLPKPNNQGTPIGFVQRETGGFATVLWTGTSTSAPGGSRLAELKIDDLPHAGKYDGEISFNKEENKTGVMAIGVMARDIVIWPILVIVGGIYIAFVTKRYLGVLRVSWRLRQQEAAIGDAFREAQRQFTDATKGTAYAGYSLAKDVAEQRKNITMLLDSIEKNPWTTDLTNDRDYKNATSSLQTLQSEIVAWGQLGPELSSLAQSLSTLWDGIDGNLTIPQTSSPSEPTFLTQARNLLTGTDLKGTDLDPLRKEVAEATSASQVWVDVNEHAKNVTATFLRLQNGSDTSDAEKTILNGVRDQLVSVWTHLWNARNVSDLTNISASGSDLDSAEISLARIESVPQRIPPTSVFSFDRALMLTRPPTFVRSSSLSDINHLPANDDRRFEVLTRAIRHGDRGSAILAFAIALLTGLNANYLNKPFGTLQDYITVFLWAVGTKATLDILTSVFDKFSPSLSKGTIP